jgi:multimeric flavodoxin WrbA
MKTLIIIGSARRQGDTALLVRTIQEKTGWDVIDLNDYQISYYDYEHKNREDDFLPLMRKIIPAYDLFIFASPLYWYTMSAIMKVFFDRISDLLTIEKDLGRKLRGKSMAAIACSGSDDLHPSFWHAFEATAGYLGMHYAGQVHGIIEDDAVTKQTQLRIDGFIAGMGL